MNDESSSGSVNISGDADIKDSILAGRDIIIHGPPPPSGPPLTPDEMDDALSDYLKAVAEVNEYIDLRGIPIPGDIRVPLEKVYIRLRASPKYEAEIRRERELLERHEEVAGAGSMIGEINDILCGFSMRLLPEPSEPEEVDTSSPVEIEDALGKHDHLVILGGPGIGKSTLLRPGLSHLPPMCYTAGDGRS